MKPMALPLAFTVACLMGCAGTDSLPSNPSRNYAQNDMEQQVYTHALWRVKPGNEDAFIEAWTTLAETFSTLDQPPLWGTLLRSTTEPNVFYSFGPWRSATDVEQMRNSAVAQGALSELRQLCEEATPGMYHVIKHIEVEAK